MYEDAKLMDIEEWELAQTNIYFNNPENADIEVNQLGDDALDKRIQELESKVMQNDKRGEA